MLLQTDLHWVHCPMYIETCSLSPTGDFKMSNTPSEPTVGQNQPNHAALTIFVHIGFLGGHRGQSLHHGGPLLKARLRPSLLSADHAVVHAARAEAWNREAHLGLAMNFRDQWPGM